MNFRDVERHVFGKILSTQKDIAQPGGQAVFKVCFLLPLRSWNLQPQEEMESGMGTIGSEVVPPTSSCLPIPAVFPGSGTLGVV